MLALAFQEDFAIVDGSNATLPWLAVTLPSHWAPEAKVGRHFAEVHAPVADNRLLLAAGEHLMRLVTQADRWQRFVWQITPHRELHHHPAHSPARHWPQDASPEAVAARAWFRTERQTFIPVPSVRQAVFTIQVDNQPLTEAVTDPAHAALALVRKARLIYERGQAEEAEALLETALTEADKAGDPRAEGTTIGPVV